MNSVVPEDTFYYTGSIKPVLSTLMPSKHASQSDTVLTGPYVFGRLQLVSRRRANAAQLFYIYELNLNFFVRNAAVLIHPK